MPMPNRTPTELIEEIVLYACAYCVPQGPCQRSPQHEDCPKYPSTAFRCTKYPDVDHYSDLSTLWSLCLTSRQLNDIATRHLYHRPFGAHDAETWWPLARTLISRPDIAAHVKELHLDEFKDLKGPALLQEISDSIPSSLLVRNGRDGRAPPSASDEQRWTLLRLMGGEEASCMDLMINLCPNLETFEAAIDIFNDVEWYYIPLFTFCQPQSMPALRNLTIIPKKTRSGMSFAHILDLLKAAPNLTTICSSNLASFDRLGFKLCHVTSLDLKSSAIDDYSLANIFRSFPNLETFTYQSGPEHGEIPFLLWQIEGTLQFAPKLKRLSLDLAEDEMLWYFEDIEGFTDESWEDLEKALSQRDIAFHYKRCKSRSLVEYESSRPSCS